MCWGADADEALERAHHAFRWSALGWKVQAELPNPRELRRRRPGPAPRICARRSRPAPTCSPTSTRSGRWPARATTTSPSCRSARTRTASSASGRTSSARPARAQRVTQRRAFRPGRPG
jgi:hypothetical protein